MKKASCIGALLLLGMLCLPPLTARAAGLDIHAWLEGNHIITLSDLGGGSPAGGASVRVLDSDTGKVLVQGRASANGVFSFPVPNVVQDGHGLTIMVDAGQGRSAEWQIDAPELYAAASLTAGFDQDAINAQREAQAARRQRGAYQIPSHEDLAAPQAPAPQAAKTAPSPAAQAHASAAAQAPQSGALADDSPLSPQRTGMIERAMADQERRAALEGDSRPYGSGPTIANVIGGLGWIVGLVGIFLYWRARRELAGKKEEN